MTAPLVVLGDALLDRDLDGSVDRLCPDAPVPVVDDPVGRSRPGGAALAATLAARGGADVVLVTALAGDGPGQELRALLQREGVAVEAVPLEGPTPEKVRVCSSGRPLLRVDHGARATPPGPLSEPARRSLERAGAVLVSDYGRGLTARDDARAALGGLPRRTPIVWDPHPRGSAPTAGVRLATPNRRETALLAGARAEDADDGMATVTGWAQRLLERWRATSIAVTLGGTGALFVGPDGPPMAVPAPHIAGADPCGAGDRFAGAACAALLHGALPSEAVIEAVAAASAFVAQGGAGALFAGDGDARAAHPASAPDPVALAREVRDRGGTVVATGGCFDLLHAGHVGLLQQARRLGDCLIVCLNSDSSVRRLKGLDRPLQRQEDRAAVLRALDCVDAVAVFDDDTPVPLLERLRPHVFAKGADYAVADLPEARALAAWAGQAVVLPYLPGRSTSQIIDLAQHRATRREHRAR